MSGSPPPTCTHNELVTAMIITASGDNTSHLAVEYHDLVTPNPNRTFEPAITVSPADNVLSRPPESIMSSNRY